MLKRVALPLIAVLALSACGGGPSGESPSTGATGGTTPAGDSLTVVTAFYPLEWASSQVLGDAGTVTTLTAPGVEPHDLELTPRQVASLADADLVVYLKGFQSAVDEAVEQSGAKNVLDVSTVVNLVPTAEEHEHEHDEADDDEEEGHDHDHGAFDPHFWQDPERMVAVVNALKDKLSAAMPDDATQLSANAEATVKTLNDLNGEFTTGLASCERKEFITTHEAFHYLAERYGLTQIGISGINPDAEPSPARVAEIHDEAKEHGITTIFFETLTSPALAEAIAGDLGLKTAVLDPLEGVTATSPGTDYPSIMRANLEALRTANGCQ
ncbi:MAG: metal ABC transporter substrate-binding protein [Arachnia sp.]